MPGEVLAFGRALSNSFFLSPIQDCGFPYSHVPSFPHFHALSGGVLQTRIKRRVVSTNIDSLRLPNRLNQPRDTNTLISQTEIGRLLEECISNVVSKPSFNDRRIDRDV